MNFGLTRDTIEKVQAVFRTYPEVSQVILYGSRAKGNFRPGSDIDLVIQNSDIDFKKLNQIRTDLEALHTPYIFDLSVFENIESENLLDHIRRVGKVFYSKI